MHKGKTPHLVLHVECPVGLAWLLRRLTSQGGGNTGCYYCGLLCLSGVLKEDSKQITEFRLLVAEPFFS